MKKLSFSSFLKMNIILFVYSILPVLILFESVEGLNETRVNEGASTSGSQQQLEREFIQRLNATRSHERASIVVFHQSLGIERELVDEMNTSRVDEPASTPIFHRQLERRREECEINSYVENLLNSTVDARNNGPQDPSSRIRDYFESSSTFMVEMMYFFTIWF